MNLREELLHQQDLKYKAFHHKLVPEIDPDTMIGVRLPVLRKLAKQALKESAENECCYYEEKMIYGLTLGMKKCSWEEHRKDLEKFIPMIDNWAICDSCCASFKFTRQYRKELYPFIISYLNKSEFEARFAIVMLMDYYLTDDYIDEVIQHLCAVKTDAYYVNMAIAWTVQAIFVQYRSKALALLEQKVLSPFVQNKAIQKIRDSYRVSEEDKALIKQYRIKP